MLETILLAILQGLTEFLPISSSAHLILLPQVLGFEDQGLTLDVMVHFGSLLAVIIYFRFELICLLKGALRTSLGKPSKYYSKLFNYLVIATIPVMLGGLLLHDIVKDYLRSPYVIALSTIGFGVLLAISALTKTNQKKLIKLKIIDTIWIGLFQVLALIPGTSRSGITLTAGIFRGLNYKAAAKFSFLLSIPVILAATGLEIYKLNISLQDFFYGPYVLAIVISFITAFLAIHWFLKFIIKVGVMPFVIYRIILGLYLLIYFVP